MEICYDNERRYRVADSSLCDNPQRMLRSFDRATESCTHDIRCKSVSCDRKQEECWIHYTTGVVAALDSKRR